MGYFAALIGRVSVAALVAPGVETPSDMTGVMPIKITGDGDDGWKLKLAKEMQGAGLPVVKGSTWRIGVPPVLLASGWFGEGRVRLAAGRSVRRVGRTAPGLRAGTLAAMGPV